MTRRGHGEGSIYQRTDGRWAATITIEGRKRKTFYGKTRKEVQNQLKAGLSSTTVRTLHNVLHKALDNAVRWNLVARNVCDVVSPPRKKRFEIQPLTAEQALQLIVAAKDHPNRALFVLAIATGMRRGELLGLKWRDLDMKTGTVHIRRILSRVPTKVPGKGYVEAEPKTEKSRRSVVLPSFAFEALKLHQEQQQERRQRAGVKWQEFDYVFCTSIGTHLHPDRDVWRQLKELLKQAGLPEIRFHDLRHSAATLMLSKDVHPKVVQEILGHSQISMTMDIYSHVLPTMQQEAMNKMNDVFKES